jgi:hypothetical protein
LKKCNKKCNNEKKVLEKKVLEKKVLEKKVLEKKVLEKKNGVEKLKVFNNIKSSFQYFIFLYISSYRTFIYIICIR